MRKTTVILIFMITSMSAAQETENTLSIFTEKEITPAKEVGESAGKPLNFKSFIDDMINDIDASSAADEKVTENNEPTGNNEPLAVGADDTPPDNVLDTATPLPERDTKLMNNDPAEKAPSPENKSFVTQKSHPDITKNNWVSNNEFDPAPSVAEVNVISPPKINNDSILLDESPAMRAALSTISYAENNSVIMIFTDGYDYYDIVKPGMNIIATAPSEKITAEINGEILKVTLNAQNDLVVELLNKMSFEKEAEKKAHAESYPVVVADVNKTSYPELKNSETLAEALARHKAKEQESPSAEKIYDRNVPYEEKISIIPRKLTGPWKKSYEEDRETVLTNEKDIALTTPKQGKYIDGVVFYNYSDNSKYLIYLTTDLASVIHLEPGEYPIVAPVITNPDAFNVVHTSYGTALGKDPKSHVLVINALAANTNGSLIVTTNRRIYHFILQSTEGFATQIVKFTWPRPVEFNLPERSTSPPPLNASESGRKVEKSVLKSYERGILPNEMQFRYDTQIGCDHGHECSAFQRKQSEKLIPDNIFDDQEYTYIMWHNPPKKAPILLSITPGQEQKIINYNVKENMYIAHGVFEEAVLMLDEYTFVLIKNKNLEIKNHG